MICNQANRVRSYLPVPSTATLLAGCLLIFAGCSEQRLNEYYGYRSGYGRGSINGTSVFAAMLEDAGHRIRSTAGLYPRVEKADVIVWFSLDFDVPSTDAQFWLDDWMRYGENEKTLIYVSRDYSAGPLYWTIATPRAPQNQQPEFNRRLGQSRSRFSSERGSAPVDGVAEDWFSFDRRRTKRKVAQLRGPWSEGVDATKAAIEHRRYLTPSPLADVLLEDEQGHPLVSEIVYDASEVSWTTHDSRLIMIENGSFLLNGSLVNKEHRKLAGRLINHLGSPQLDVVFLESDSAPLILDSDPSEGPPTGLALLKIWPIGAVLAQIAALGLVFIMASWPIFGKPRRLAAPPVTDFHRHIAALGQMLAATRDRAYAVAQLRSYFQTNSERTAESAVATNEPDET